MVLVKVKVKPRSHKDEVIGVDEAGLLRVSVRAIPDKGAANTAVIKVLADFLQVPKTSITLIKGPTSSQKTFSIESYSEEELRKKLYD